MRIFIGNAWFEVVDGLPAFEQAFPNSLATQAALTVELERLAEESAMSVAGWVAARAEELPEPVPEPLPPDWDAFNGAIMVDPRLNAVMGTVLGIAPAIALGLPSALAQVSTQGSSAFQITLEALCKLGGAVQGDRDGWAVMAETHHLPTDFVAIVRGNG